MIADRLAIPMHTNPARQKLWRAVRLFGLLLGAIVLGYLIDRAIHYRSSPQRWPLGASVELRLIKTPRISRFVNAGFTNVQALPGSPWSIAEALSWSKRELVIYADDQDVVGLVIDRQLPAEVLASLANWGWTALPVGQRTLVIRENTLEPTATERHLNLWLTMPIFDGAIAIKDANSELRALPFRFSSATSLDFPVNTRAFIPAAQLTLPSGTELIGSLSLPPDLAGTFIPASVPAAFPGLETLSAQSKTTNIDLLLGQDEQGQAFAIALLPSHGEAGRGGRLTLEQLGAIASEGVGLQTLSTQALTIDELSTSTEIRSSEDINVNLSNNDNLDIAVAEAPDHQLFRLTQSDQQLLISNRAAIIGPASAEYSGSCLHHPAGFLRPNELSTSLPSLRSELGFGLIDHLLAADEIAYRKNWLRICW